MTQQQKILEKLNEGNWVCSTELINLYSVDYRSVINKLRKKGYDIKAKPCNLGHTHNGRMNMWFLETTQTQNSAITACCYSKVKFGTHDPNCPVLDQLKHTAQVLEQEAVRNLKLL